MSTQPLNILMIGPYPFEPGKIVGGIEAVTSALVPALAAHEQVAKVTVLCHHQGETATRRERVSEKLEILYVRGQQRMRLVTRSILDVWQARRLVAELRPDVVHGHGLGRRGDLAVQLSAAPVITVHGLPQREARLNVGHSLKRRLRAQVADATYERVLRRARVVVSISEYDARTLQQLVRGQRVSIPNPIAAEFFAPAPPRDGDHILFAGVMSRRKNLEGLLNGFALVRKAVAGARLVVVGPTPDPVYAAEVRARVGQLGLGEAVEFVGHVENERLIAELRGCGAVALFSHEETAPTIIAQALALGKPVVASRVGGVPEMVVDGETGFLVAPGDEQALAERLATLIQLPKLRREMGERGREAARQRYESSAVASRTIEAYRLALSPVYVAQQAQRSII